MSRHEFFSESVLLLEERGGVLGFGGMPPRFARLACVVDLDAMLGLESTSARSRRCLVRALGGVHR
jgi:hypothetical protein